MHMFATCHLLALVSPWRSLYVLADACMMIFIGDSCPKCQRHLYVFADACMMIFIGAHVPRARETYMSLQMCT